MPAASLARIRERLASGPAGPADLAARARELRALAAQAQRDGDPVRRIALASDLTPDFLAHAIACGLALEGELALLHVVPAGTALQACLDPASALHAFRPELAVLVPDWRETVAPQGRPADDAAQVRHFEQAWGALRAQGCTVIQQLLVPPAERLRGVADRRDPASAVARVQAINEALLQAGSAHVAWLEADRIAAHVGLAAWSAPRYYHAAKLPFDPRFLPEWMAGFRGAWRSATGRAKKLLVLDLDGTLWDGVVGEDGPDGLVLGPAHGASGEAFAAWQRYLRELGRRGIALAVCSKNDREAALAGLAHPDGVLRPGDFACLECSWDDKAEGLRRIARALDLGLDAMVFVDDDPAERALVLRELPAVAVVDPGPDPSGFPDRLAAGHWFDHLQYTEEDFGRAAAYAGRARAEAARDAATDLDSFLAGLEMRGRVAPARPADLARLAQMEGKTNQFNTTLRRRTQAELADLLARPDHHVMTLRLCDRFADHGLVSSLVAVQEGDALRIDSWLLSCRVFGRGVEAFMLAALSALARELGAKALVGEFLPGTRNGMVAGLYRRFGFAPQSGDARWWRRAPAAPGEWPSAIAHEPSA